MRRAQIGGAILFLVGFVLMPTSCLVASRGASWAGLAMLAAGGIIYIIGKLGSA